jgi:hypothetical protein
MKVVQSVFVKNHETQMGKWFHPGDDMPDEWAAWVTNATIFDPTELVALEDLPYDKWTVDELRTEALNRGLGSASSKRALVKLLTEHDEAQNG